MDPFLFYDGILYFSPSYILAFKDLTARLTISHIDDQPAYVTEELLDQRSPAFTEFASNLANAVSYEYKICNTIIDVQTWCKHSIQ